MPDVTIILPSDLPLSPGVNDADQFIQSIAGKLYRCPASLAKAYFASSGGTSLSTPSLTVTPASSSQINLSWSNVANESSYRLEWSPNGSSGWTQIGGTIAANTTSYNHTGLSASTTYYYRLKAVGDGVTYLDSGYSTGNAATSGAGLTPLSTPTLTATPASSSQINLSWTNVANESSYRLEWSPNGTSGWTQIGGTIAANTTSYNHTGLTASTVYYYRVKAVGDGVTYSDSGYGTDSDTTSAGSTLASAFIAAVEAGGTALSPTIETALGALETVINGIGASKFDVVYPFCGGAAQSHKWNFMNPLDTDAGFRGTFAGTVTHNANGITGNATDGYMDTKFNPSTHSTANNIHMAVYISAGTAAGRHGCNSDSNAKNLLIGPAISGNDYIRCYGTGSDGQIVYTNSDRTDSFILSRRSGTDLEAYKGGVSQGTATGSTGVSSPPNSNVYVLAENAAGTAGSFADDTVQFFSLGEGLTDAEVTALHNGIVAFQTALSR